jgi:hypothetical protein
MTEIAPWEDGQLLKFKVVVRQILTKSSLVTLISISEGCDKHVLGWFTEDDLFVLLVLSPQYAALRLLLLLLVLLVNFVLCCLAYFLHFFWRFRIDLC